MSYSLLIMLITIVTSIVAFNNSAFMEKLILVPYRIKHNHEYYRFITSGIVHANWLHLGFNMISFYFFAGLIESYFGPNRFLLLYIGSVVIANIPTYLKYADKSRYGSLGASGGVSAILFAFVIIHPFQTIYIYFIPVPAILFGVFYILYSYIMDKKGSDEVNHSAHLYGALVGLIYTSVLYPEVAQGFVQKILSVFI
jgi:membrane associated rhomboid family serine protease